jgi:preprotein translocase subunit SecD
MFRDSIKWRVLLVIAVTALCVFFYFKNGLKQGLDLRGGVHLVLLMDTDVSVYNRVQTDLRTVEEQLKNKNVPFSKLYSDNKEINSIFVEGDNPNLGVTLRDLADKTLNNYSFSALGGGRFRLTLSNQFEQNLRDQAVQQSVEVIRNRIDKYGVAEPAIHRQGMGSNKIVVELPGVEDSTEIKALIGKAAQLEWHIAVAPKQGAPTRDAILKEYGGNLPPDVAIYPGSRDKYGSEIYFALKTVAPVTGADLQEVRVEANQYGQPAVGFILTATAGQRFRELTRTHLHEPLAIVLDGNVISSPVINAEIGDRGIIEGNFTTQEAQELVFQLKSGALPAIPRFAEERTIGPSMGLASIRKGTVSGLIGLVAILAFMFLYYRASGINANFCLLLNLVILIGVMSTFGLTLTVPGIAGIILTLGMSIDANVLIFERIKDELLENKTVQTAISGGFSKAFITIFDTHVTDWVSALFLLQFGTGPVRGFAVTLTVGLIANMFTAIFVSRLIYDIVMDLRSKGGKRPTDVSIGPVNSFRGLKIPFMKYKVHFVIASVILIAIGMWSVATKGLNWGIDFRGGQELQVRFSHSVDPRSVEATIKKGTTGSVTVVAYGKPEDNEVLVRMDARDDKGQLLSEDAIATRSQQILSGLRSPDLARELAGGKLDLNTSGTRSLEDLILGAMHSGALSGSDEQGKALAQGIMDYKREHGGLMASVDDLKKVPGMSDAMFTYLMGKVVAGDFAIQRIDTVGPTVGKELQTKALQAVIGSLIGILLYAWFRFQFRFSVGAILSLIHDMLMAVGLVSLFQVEVNLPTIAALLTLLGYSINDTIVVFDRVREHMKKERKQEDDDLFNRSINETLSRTLITSLLTFFVVVAMLIFGGEVLFSFSFVMTVGIIVGTYSSIFVATPYVLWWDKLGVERFFKGGKKRR